MSKLLLLFYIQCLLCCTLARNEENNKNEENTTPPLPNGRSFFLIGAIFRRVRDRWMGYNEPSYAGPAFPLAGYYNCQIYNCGPNYNYQPVPAPPYVQQPNPYYVPTNQHQQFPQPLPQQIPQQMPQQQQQQQQQHSNVVIYHSGQNGQYPPQPSYYYQQQGVQSASPQPMPYLPNDPSTNVIYNSGYMPAPPQFNGASPYPAQNLPIPPPHALQPQGLPFPPGGSNNCMRPYACPLGG